jgi:hypothetical protein
MTVAAICSAWPAGQTIRSGLAFLCVVTGLVIGGLAALRLIVVLAGQDGEPHPVAVPVKVAHRMPVVGIAHQRSPSLQSVRQSKLLTSSDDAFNAQLRDPAFWAERKSSRSKRSSVASEGRSNLGRSLNSDLPVIWTGRSGGEGSASSGRGTYRTMCVRLCDGFFWPVSFQTTAENFDADRQSCESSCVGAKLYRYRNPGDDVDDMEDMEGEPYKKLKTAFRFKTTYDETCKCRAHPWEEASLDRHKLYAMERRLQRGDKSVAQDIVALRAKVRTAEHLTPAVTTRASAKVAEAVDDVTLQTRGHAKKKRAAKSTFVGAADGDGGVRGDGDPVKPGVVMLRLGARPPIAVKVARASGRRSAAEDDWRRRAFWAN